MSSNELPPAPPQHPAQPELFDDELAELMIDYNVGVTVAQVYEVKRVDSDYFAEGE